MWVVVAQSEQRNRGAEERGVGVVWCARGGTQEQRKRGCERVKRCCKNKAVNKTSPDDDCLSR